MINGWTTGAFKPPTTINEIYRVAGNWVKPTSRSEGGTSATYVTIEEDAAQKRCKEQEKKTRGKGADEKEKGAKTPDSEGQEKKNRSQLECWYCKEKGHFSSRCPKRKADREKQGQGFANATWQEEFCMFCTTSESQEYVVNNAVNVTQQLRKTEVLLNNQADISIVHPMLLENERPAEREIKVKGVGGVQMKVNKVGDLPNFFKVYASAESKANVLSFADVEDLYDITYVRQQAFVVHMRDRVLVFSRREKLYIVDIFDEEYVMQATVRENEALYRKEEVRRAKEAYEFLKNSGYPR
jgi:hypothetical protein